MPTAFAARESGEEMDMNMKQRLNLSEIQVGIQAEMQGLARKHPLHSSRSGSALLIVIGTLALISVFAVIYVSIGRTDRRAATAVRTQRDQDASSQRFSEYLSSIVGNDRLDASVQIDGNGLPFGRREVIDAPYTDWTKRSSALPGFENQLFSAVGGPISMDGFDPVNDMSVASDPWLASTTPVYLGNPGTQNAFRPFSSFEGFDPNYPNSKNYMDNRDWLQISNFADDGRFVNLYNLRPNESFGDGTIGSYFAESGAGSVSIDGRQIRRMSDHLSLWVQENQADPAARIMTFVPGDNGDQVWVPGQNLPINIGLTDLENIPAVWTMYQRFMNMPINQPFITLNRAGVESTWADPDYPVYQYGDADGNGFADSRWIELSSARDAGENGSTDPRDDIEVLYNKKDYRYFIAARAVDLSSMVNINTATDLSMLPTKEFPQGLTPADVDLSRLLSMQDPGGDFTAGRNIFHSLSYAHIHRPFWSSVPDASGQVEPIIGDWNNPRPNRDYVRNPTDYVLYQQGFDPASPVARDLRSLTPDAPSMLIGRYAYDALRRGILQGSSLTHRYAGASNGGTLLAGSDELFQYESHPLTPGTKLTPEQRFDQFMNIGRLDPSNRGTSWARDVDLGSGALYGLEDLTELLTFHGLNDPDATSRLERVMNGRYQSANGDELQTQRMSPLLSNRPLSLDRDQHGFAIEDVFTMNPSDRPGVTTSTERGYNGGISINSMALAALTPRNKMTTHSGNVGLIPSQLLEDPSIANPLTELTAAPSLTTLLGSTSQLFDLYASALVGELDVDHEMINGQPVWEPDVASFGLRQGSTLFYGHRGPEMALRIAAHSAVNMKDLADTDTDPSIATLILDSDPSGNGTTVRDYFTAVNPAVLVPTDLEYQLYPGAADGNLFDLDPRGTPAAELQLANGEIAGFDTKRQVVNVYGFEAMPVITEVSVLYAYTDAPGAAGGDPDFGVDPTFDILSGAVIYPDIADIEPITINGAAASSNSDYLVQVLAFQLHNPYGQDISLGGGEGIGSPLTRQRADGNPDAIDPQSNYQFNYYIEFAGRFYKLAEYLEHYPVRNQAPPGPGDFYVGLDDPSVTTAFGTVNNPVTGIPILGDRLDPGTQTSVATVPGVYPPGTIAPFSDFMSRNIVLRAGETRVFYVIADKRFDAPATGLDQRWIDQLQGVSDTSVLLPYTDTNLFDFDGDGLANGLDGMGWTGPAEEYINNQFEVLNGVIITAPPVHMVEFDPRDGQNLNEVASATVLEDPTTVAANPLFPARDQSNLEVRLWKKIVTIGEESNDSGIPAAERTLRNLVENDLLVDRMTLDDVLTVPLFSGAAGDITGTVSFSSSVPTVDGAGFTVRNDNTGITIARWKTNRRKDYPTAAQSQTAPSLGQVTPWMLGSRSNPLANRVVHNDRLNISPTVTEIFDPVVLTDDIALPESEVTIKGDFEISDTFVDFYRIPIVNDSSRIVQTMALPPHQKYDVEAQPDFNDGPNESAVKFPPSPMDVTGTAIESLNAGIDDAVPEIFVGGGTVGEKPRLADLLLGWGIGPTYAPDPTRAPNLAEYHAEEWMTGPEAMAIALGVENPAISTDTDGLWTNAYGQSSTKPLLDDGHLVLDDFVPYLNVDTSETQPDFDVGIDVSRGLGVPLALGVIDHARAIEPLTQITDPNTLTPTPEQRLELALTRATFGNININTAPIEVLRLLPGLTPSRGVYEGPGGGVFDWMGRSPNAVLAPGSTDLTATNLPTLDTTILEENPDVAAAIVAYRDRTYGVPNTAARSDLYGIDYDDATLNFEPTNPLLFASNMQGELAAITFPAIGDVKFDRKTMTGIDGLRSTPGFGSLGELLAVRVDPAFEGTDLERWNRLKHLSIQQYGFDDKFSGIDSATETTIMSQLFDGDQTGTNMDDYAEKISMANSVLNTLSVRSDFFAVWFVVQGYQESDVANLRPEEPLIPSIHKRYLMVVDRTNVIEPGDKPKILVFKELPL